MSMTISAKQRRHSSRCAGEFSHLLKSEGKLHRLWGHLSSWVSIWVESTMADPESQIL